MKLLHFVSSPVFVGLRKVPVRIFVELLFTGTSKNLEELLVCTFVVNLILG